MKRKIIATLLSVTAGLSVLIGVTHGLNTFSDLRIAPVDTQAMSPAVFDGSLIISALTPEDQIKTGDIITLGLGDQRTNQIGRVISITSDSGEYFNISLKSDQNALPDDFPYKTRDVAYKMVFSIPVLGYIFQGLTTIPGIVLLTLFTAVLAWLYLFRFHAAPSATEKQLKQTGKARRKAMRRLEERPSTNSVEEMKAFFADEESEQKTHA